MNELPQNSCLHILSYLELPDAASLTTISKKTIPVHLQRHPIPLSETSRGLVGQSNTGESVHWQSSSSLPGNDWSGPTGAPLSLTHSIELCWDWSDQGWGNQKGALAITLSDEDRAANDYETPPATEITSTLRQGSRAYAPHSDSPRSLSYHPTDSSFAIWLKAGGGGGHMLNVSGLRARVVYYELL